MEDKKIQRQPEQPEKVEFPLDIPFKEFMPGQLIESQQFNDDMRDIEQSVNETISNHNSLVERVYEHQFNFFNPHSVNAHQVGTYEGKQIDEFINDLKDGNLYDKSISNRVLGDEVVGNRVLANQSVTNAKVDPELGSQLDISKNMEIKNRYTKQETDELIYEKVGEGTYSKNEIDDKFEEYQAGTIVDGTIDATKLKSDVGEKLDISANPVFDKYVEKGVLITTLENYVTNSRLEDSTNSIYASITNLSNTVFDNHTFVNNRIDEIRDNIGNSHNHDDRYAGKWNPTINGGLNVGDIRLSTRDVAINGKRALVGFGNDDGNKLVINFDNDYGNGVEVLGRLTAHDVYIKKHRPILDTYRNGYYGLTTPDADEHDWLRTTGNGLIPFQSGGYSNIGTSGWKFNEGWFNTINANTINVHKNGDTSSINFSAQLNDPGFIRHIENNNVSGMYFSVSDDSSEQDVFSFGASPSGQFIGGAVLTADGKLWLRKWLESEYASMTMGGRHVYFDGQKPSHAPDGSISFG